MKAGEAQAGFTLIEMIVAVTLIAGVLLTMSYALYGAMGGLTAARQRSAFVEIANGEMETLRANDYAAVGVHEDDNRRSELYAGGTAFEGRDAVVIDEDDFDEADVPAAYTRVTSSQVTGIVLPYTVRRWVTWTGVSSTTAREFKRLKVEVEWVENNRSTRRLALTSLLYPGGGEGVVAPNQAPVAVMAAPNPASGAPGTSFAFDGSGSGDPDPGDSIASWSWNFGDGFTGSGSTVNHVYTAAGNYTVTLTVTDSRGLASQAVSRNVTVGATNTPPTASFTYTPLTGTAPLSVDFTSTSTDTQGPIATWRWNWGDGTAQGTAAQATHVFQSAGTYTVTLTVTDTGGLSSSATASIVVNPLNCDVTSGSFRNPWNGSGTALNDIRVSSGTNKPSNRSFSFTATSNTACTGVTARLPYQGSILTVVLTNSSTSNGVKTWTGNGSVGGNDRFNLGNNQNATMTGTGSGGATDLLTYAFNVHT